MKSRLVCALAFLTALTLTSHARAQSPGADSGYVLDATQIQPASTDVSKGEVLFSVPTRYAHTGRLQNEIRTNRRPWAHPNDIPAGTPVFAHTFEKLGRVWCAVAKWNGDLRSICFAPIGDKSARAYLGSPYAAPGLTPDFFLQAPAQVVEDPNVEFPAMETVYSLDRWTKNGVILSRGLRVNGVIYYSGQLNVPRTQEGPVGLSMNGRNFRIKQVGEQGAHVVALP